MPKPYSAFGSRKFNDLPSKVMNNCMSDRNVDKAIDHLVKKKYGTRNEIVYAVNQGAGQEVVEVAYDDYGWRP